MELTNFVTHGELSAASLVIEKGQLMESEIVRPWYNASSNDGSSCVDVQFHRDGTVKVRNSKRPDEAITSFTSEEWAAFITGAKGGLFDPLV